jgi:aquaporin NIP
MKNYLAEFFGTFAILFIGAGSIAIDIQTEGSVTLLGISAIFGVMVTLMIILFGHISGAHFNPAVSLAFAMTKRFPWKEFFPYFISQLLGGLLAIVILKLIFPDFNNLALTLPSVEPIQAFFFEIILALLLVLTILFVSDGRNTILPASWLIGGMVILEIYLGANISGASFNPVRSLPPAIVFDHWENLWIYITAPFIGAAFGYFIFKTLHKEKYV